MDNKPDTSGDQPKAEYKTVNQVVSEQSNTTQTPSLQVRTVPTRLQSGHVSLRYAPIKQARQDDISTSE